ncbi:anti-sigma factor [Mycobacterium sp. ITM-2016-00318]|uniref:anti-sigma factor family protein n=1 Tax=Mycobacterium sp. ITM-2016-00318 TaxID=2099693 RepID=UPI000CF9A713|nr:zf-HC2 domain-containing protein [Mycobacterium sp. ITM-2016-00318]WNG95686.1 zf-HC2 domain-containing protein [Mycobacterium sp. ITM-2016-00318]
MDCNELVELVTSYLDGSLDPDTRARVDVHLLECDGCANYLQQFRATVDTLGKVDDETLDPSFRDRLMNAFRDWR